MILDAILVLFSNDPRSTRDRETLIYVKARDRV